MNIFVNGKICPLITGADLANLINQAALHGSAIGNEAVTRDDIDFARDKIIMGPERKSAVIEEKNRKLVAYHEGGHAIVALYTPGLLLRTTLLHNQSVLHSIIIECRCRITPNQKAR